MVSSAESIFTRFSQHTLTKRTQRGSFTSIIVLAVVVLIGFIGFRFGRVYFNHATLVNEIRDSAKNGLISKSYDIAMRIPSLVRASGGQVDESEIKVNYSIDFDAVSVSFPYERNIDFILINQPWTLKVDFAVEAPKAVESVNKAVDGIDSGMKQYQDKVDKQLNR